jgi:hypothetical protein
MKILVFAAFLTMLTSVARADNTTNAETIFVVMQANVEALAKMPDTERYGCSETNAMFNPRWQYSCATRSGKLIYDNYEVIVAEGVVTGITYYARAGKPAEHYQYINSRAVLTN